MGRTESSEGIYRVASTTDERDAGRPQRMEGEGPTLERILSGSDDNLGFVKEQPIPYGRFADMFLPGLLEQYNESLKQAPTPSLYEKITPILYWRPKIEGEELIETTMSGGRRPVVEVVSKIDFGRDVVACNLMTEDKEVAPPPTLCPTLTRAGIPEVWKLDMETLHRNYLCPESGINQVRPSPAVRSRRLHGGPS
jgi:hypothetical protein